MKNKKILLLVSALPLFSCARVRVVKQNLFLFDTMVDISISAVPNVVLYDIESILMHIDEVADRYRERISTNVYTINHSSDELVSVDSDLYEMLYKAYNAKNEGATYFNPLCGGLSDLWKNSLVNYVTPNYADIEIELNKMNSSSIEFFDYCRVEKVGDATIDLGGIAKGFALDKVKEYFTQHDIKTYLINAGSSSILLGEKRSNDGLYTIALNDVPRAYIKAKNCFVSTSSKSVQGVTINGTTYSHIVNPVTGGALNENDAVIVISDKGYLGDALSTSMMMNSIEEIQQIENEQNVKTIVIRNNRIVYAHVDIDIYHR